MMRFYKKRKTLSKNVKRETKNIIYNKASIRIRSTVFTEIKYWTINVMHNEASLLQGASSNVNTYFTNNVIYYEGF